MRIENILLTELKMMKPSGKTEGEREEASHSGDAVEISKEAKLFRSHAIQANRESSLVRQDKVSQALQRVKSGYYETPEVRRKTAEILLKSSGMEEIVARYHRLKVAKGAQRK